MVELLVVIAIISILTVISVAQFNTAKMKARDVQRKGDIDGVRKALNMYYTDHEMFPSADEINGYLAGGGEFVDSDGYVYIKEVPTEKTSGRNPYCYEVLLDARGNPNMYALYSELENENDGDYRKYDSVNGYSCTNGGVGRDYDYVIYSPNAGRNEFND